MAEPRHLGSCACGEVVVELTGEPLVMCFCHCASCRGWLGAPIHAATLWPVDRVEVRQGRASLGLYDKTERSHRRFCTRCGGHVMNEHPSDGTIDVLAAVLRDFAFRPTMHVHYQERVLPVRDGLPKFKDFPAELGGSGEKLPD